MEALLNSKLRQGFGPSRVARIGPVRIMKWFCPIFLVLCLPEKTGWKHPAVQKVQLCGHHLEGFCSRDSAGICRLRVRAPRFHTNRKPPTNPVLSELLRAVSAGRNSYGIVGAVCLYTEIRHHFESHFDIRRGNYFACEGQLQSVLHIRCYHE